VPQRLREPAAVPGTVVAHRRERDRTGRGNLRSADHFRFRLDRAGFTRAAEAAGGEAFAGAGATGGGVCGLAPIWQGEAAQAPTAPRARVEPPRFLPASSTNRLFSSPSLCKRNNRLRLSTPRRRNQDWHLQAGSVLTCARCRATGDSRKAGVATGVLGAAGRSQVLEEELWQWRRGAGPGCCGHDRSWRLPAFRVSRLRNSSRLGATGRAEKHIRLELGPHDWQVPAAAGGFSGSGTGAPQVLHQRSPGWQEAPHFSQKCLSTSHCRQRESRDSRKIAHRIDLDARVISSAREPGKQVNSRILAVLSQGFQDHRMFPDTDSVTEGTRAHAAGPLSRQPEDFLERQESTYVSSPRSEE